MAALGGWKAVFSSGVISGGPPGATRRCLLDRELAGQQAQVRQGQAQDLALAHAGADTEGEDGEVAWRRVLEQSADLVGGEGCNRRLGLYRAAAEARPSMLS